MKEAPIIIVQLIHIEGPLKGQIVELSDPLIKIGRHPSCQLNFPPDIAIISREHAVIEREGNRFKLTDNSTNGTIVNGKKIKEIYLKDGDVITVSEGGPKVSFLTQVTDTPQSIPPATHVDSEPEQEIKPEPPVPKQAPIVPPGQSTNLPRQSRPEAPEKPPSSSKSTPVAVVPCKVPLIVQYGPTLQTFDELPVSVGSHPNSQLHLAHSTIHEMHGEIFFADERYHVKDLTGQHIITINNIPVKDGAALNENDILSLTPKGPHFRFLGNGRLIEEVIEEHETEPQPASPVTDETGNETEKTKPQSFFKRLFSKKM